MRALLTLMTDILSFYGVGTLTGRLTARFIHWINRRVAPPDIPSWYSSPMNETATFILIDASGTPKIANGGGELICETCTTGKTLHAHAWVGMLSCSESVGPTRDSIREFNRNNKTMKGHAL